MDTWVASTSWLSWTMQLWTWVYKYLFAFPLSIFCVICLEVELLDNMVVVCLIVCVCVCLFRTAPEEFLKARGGIKAATTSLHHSSQQCQILNPLSEEEIEPTSSWILVMFITSVPQWEFCMFNFLTSHHIVFHSSCTILYSHYPVFFLKKDYF